MRGSRVLRGGRGRGSDRGKAFNQSRNASPLKSAKLSTQKNVRDSITETESEDSYGILITKVESQVSDADKNGKNHVCSEAKVPSTVKDNNATTESSSSSAIELTVPENEIAELDDTDDNNEPRTNKFESEKKINDVEPTAAKEAVDTVLQPAKPPKKRKFGLEYIIVSIPKVVDGAPPNMKTAPHECVLCLPYQSFTVDALAKHVYSAQHLINVLSLHDTALYNKYKVTSNTDAINKCLSEIIPLPSTPVKLLVVTSDKLLENRKQMLASIREKKSSLQQVKSVKRPFNDGTAEASQSSPRKKPRATQMPYDPERKILVVGDERCEKLFNLCPILREKANLLQYPQARLEKILSSAIVRMNTACRVVVIVGMINDFVTERTEDKKFLRMVNPDQEELISTIKRFTLRVRNFDLNIRVVFTIPTYVDFVQYNKLIRRLQSQDFARLEDFNSQIINAFNNIADVIRKDCRNTFCYNFNRTLSSNIKDHLGVPSRALMFDTLEDGYRMSDMAYNKIAEDLSTRIEAILTASLESAPEYDSTNIECWTDCEKILVVGDYHTFKFEAVTSSQTMANVKLVPEKFAHLPKLLRTADSILTPEVDLLIIVGLYREFAQNVIDGPNTILEPVSPNKNEIYDILNKQKLKWAKLYPRLTVLLTIPHCVDFYLYNSKTNPHITPTPSFATQMANYTHQYSINVMSFYKELRPMLTLSSKRFWLYHMTNAIFQHHSSMLTTLGNFNVKPQFPPDSTVDGFKPTQAAATRMRSDIMHYATSILRKHPVKRHLFFKK